MIFFTHTGPIPLYLVAAILQARSVSHDEPIVLLSDQPENPIPLPIRHNIVIASISDYRERADLFSAKFRFEGRNSFAYELWNFQRWFVIEEYARLNKVEAPLLHLDSDAFLYVAPSTVFRTVTAPLTVCDTSGPQFVFLKNHHSLSEYTSFIDQHFSSDAGYQRLRNYVADSQDPGVPHVSDMVTLGLFGEEHDVEDIGSPSRSDFQFCENIGSSQGLRLGPTGKKIRKRKGIPHFIRHSGDLIPAGGVHLQGGNKDLWPLFASPGVRRQVLRYFPQRYGLALRDMVRKVLLALGMQVSRRLRNALGKTR